MLRAFLSVSVVVLLAGCAHQTPQTLMAAPHAAKAPIVKAPPVTPNAIVKHRWYDKFKHHPKLFH